MHDLVNSLCIYLVENASKKFPIDVFVTLREMTKCDVPAENVFLVKLN